MMKLTVTSFCLFLSVIVCAQSIDLATLPFYDCSLKKVMNIIGNPTIVVSPDDSRGLDAMIGDYCSTLGSNCILKKELALSDSDYAKNILMVGVLKDFKQWKNYHLSVLKLNNG